MALHGSSEVIADGIDMRLDPRYITLQRQVGWIAVAWFAAFCGGLVVLAVKAFDLPHNLLPYAVAVSVAAVIARGVWSQMKPSIAYRYAGYRLDGDGIEIRRGIFWRRIINVPRSRVQHTDVRQGPFERRHGLGTLVVHTAGAHHAIVSLRGLEHGTALRIRDNLLPRGTVDVV